MGKFEFCVLESVREDEWQGIFEDQKITAKLTPVDGEGADWGISSVEIFYGEENKSLDNYSYKRENLWKSQFGNAVYVFGKPPETPENCMAFSVSTWEDINEDTVLSWMENGLSNFPEEGIFYLRVRKAVYDGLLKYWKNKYQDVAYKINDYETKSRMRAYSEVALF
jgi:RNA binding exosome subunit